MEVVVVGVKEVSEDNETFYMVYVTKNRRLSETSNPPPKGRIKRAHIAHICICSIRFSLSCSPCHHKRVVSSFIRASNLPIHVASDSDHGDLFAETKLTKSFSLNFFTFQH